MTEANINDGGPAFPVTAENGYNRNSCGEGMSLRDYFAAKAMQSCVAKMAFDQPTEDMLKANGIQAADFEKFVAMLSYSMADHMLQARKCGPAEGAHQPWGGCWPSNTPW